MTTPVRVAIRLTPAAVRALRDGHRWVYTDSIEKVNNQAPAGSLAILFDRDRNFVGIGLYDPGSDIPVRTLHVGKQTTIDALWFAKAIARSLALRRELIESGHTTGYRLLHGENDTLPGLVVDRYADTLVIKLDTAAWSPWLDLLTRQLLAQTGCTRIVLRLSRRVASSTALPAHLYDGQVLAGPALSEPVVFRENGLAFEADPIQGQKTGFFLDQRDNRSRVGELSHGRDVLNVFAYTGGFTLYALRGGAQTVTSIDISPHAIAAIERNVTLNPDLDPRRHIGMCVDAFEGIAALRAAGHKYDLVVLDPPSFTHKQTDVPNALSAYRRISQLGLSVLRPGGTLVAASCSARVSAEEFFDLVQSAARQVQRPLQQIRTTGHTVDHPVGFPFGEYLKCLFAVAP